MHRTVLSLFAVVAAAALVPAQWSTSPNSHLAVANRSGEQAVPKLAATADGGAFVAWFDNAAGSYEVWLQRLDAAGNELWPHNGVLISNQPQSTSLVDWDLIADASGGAVVTFTDTRAGSDLDVYAYRVDPNGAPLWGANGVTLSNDSEYEANPRVVEVAGGEFVFAWSRSLSAGGGSIEVQRLDAGGNPLYPSGLSIPGDAGATPGFHALVAADQGGFIVAWMRDISFRGNRHLHAQKFDAAGAPQWGATRLALFDQTSLPIAHQIKMVGDGVGGAVLCWHFTPLSVFSTRIQHVDANGTERYAHNGIDVSLEAQVSKLDPAVVYDAVGGATFVVFNVRNPSQSQWGVAIQKLDAAGALQWGNDGIRLAALDGINESSQRLVRSGDGVTALWFEQPAATPQNAIRAARVRDDGTVTFGASPLLVSSAAAEKLRLAVDASPSGVALCAWTDRRTDAGDVLAQNVNPNGTLGADLATLIVYGCGVNPAGSIAATGGAALGGRIEFRVDNPLGTQPPASSTALVALAFAPAAGYPCGFLLPGFGMAAAGANGELLLDFTRLVGPALVGTPWNGPGQPSTLALQVPYLPQLAGASLYAQGVIVDPTPGAAVPIGVTDGVRARIAF